MNIEKVIKKYKPYYRNGIDTGYLVSETGRIYNTKTKSFLHPSKDIDGRYQVCLSINGISITEKIHKIVYLTYIGEIPKGYTIDHVDENFCNNYYKNLEVVTRSENISRYISNHGNVTKKYSDDFIDILCIELSNGVYYRDVAKKYDVSISYMYRIVHGSKRRKITKKYMPFPESSYRIRNNRNSDKNKVYEIISKNKSLSTKEICEMMNMDYNNANQKLITKIRNELKIQSPRFYDNEFVSSIEKMIIDGKSNKEIIKELNIDYDKKISYLFSRLRKKNNFPDHNESGVSIDKQNEILKLISDGKSNKEICEIMNLNNGIYSKTYLVNMFGRLRQKYKKQQGSTTIENKKK